MKKFPFFVIALLLAVGQVSFADVQINQGQELTTAAVKYFTGRVGRAQTISKDSVVIWDSTSKDGVSVTTSTTSGDRLVAGIAMDTIVGVSSDSLSADLGKQNWGRIQTWGLHNNVKWQTGAATAAGDAVCQSSQAGYVTDCANTAGNTSSDGTMVGKALEASASGLVDIMVSTD